MTLKPELAQVLSELLARPERTHSLDGVADAIGTLLVTADEIGELLDALESAGHSVAPVTTSARESLTVVLGGARKLKSDLGRNPTSLELAAHTGLSPDAVRLALLYARILQR